MIHSMSYNFEIKIAGKHVALKRYSKEFQYNYAVDKAPAPTKKGGSKNLRENFTRSIMRARKRVFDIIACNVDVIPDYHGQMQRPKFLTLTFKENMQDLSLANEQFTLFNKRLSYYLYGIKRNVLKYICIPEFQKRGAVHFHILYFNLPYVDFNKLGEIWGNGYIFIEGVQQKDEIEDFAKYVCKYINKENSKGEDNFDLYVEKDLLNQKRYFISRGLRKPSVYKLNIDKELYTAFLAMLKDFHASNHEYSNEYVGNVELNTYEVEEKKTVENLNNAINSMVQMMLDLYHTHVKIKWKHVKQRFMNAEHYFKSKELSEKIFYKFMERMGFIRADDWECDSAIFS
ncbi:hypothetical protein HNQ80_004305 [Anaerosolibacter carboniphilus]|uniref:Replication-associated protein ORF2/G2P domain-containing protein n=1 Tax=Anaerosolibacter carboniphilus TaxID=1417629 RepID=A0A841L7C0_9FIRM|nr:hypothetical protein [Anaerosolibacter carboniphilus]MBB6218165.1 hypothetical protein [Anaerosolibacter carboniphilus]